ncbi:MAG: flagellar biosynthetic protein FliR [Burkholderiaceae bacterium]|nr:flagellar biosynthetic protein FliR [Burkholderiaceae bacterium]
MIQISSNEIITLVASFIWPLTRILGLIVIAPPFGNNAVPARVKLVLGIGMALLVAPTLQPLPKVDLLSLTAIMILAQQFIIGMAMGFIIRVVFAGIELAGEIIGYTMGFGFASFFNPLSQTRSSAISQFLILVATAVFLALDLHLAVFASLIESFRTIPITGTLSFGFSFEKLALFGESIFRTALQLSLPVVAALLIANIALGILTRAAPQLNLYGIGFPLTIGVGFLMISLTLPYISVPIQNAFYGGIDAIQSLSVTPNSLNPAKPQPLP